MEKLESPEGTGGAGGNVGPLSLAPPPPPSSLPRPTLGGGCSWVR